MPSPTQQRYRRPASACAEPSKTRTDSLYLQQPDDDQDDASAAGGVEDVDLDKMMATFKAEKIMYHDTQKKNKEKKQEKLG